MDEVAAHLAGCESCRTEYGELSGLVPLMALIGEQDAAQGPVRAQPAVLDRMLSTSRRPSAGAHASGSGSRRMRRALVVAAGVVLAVGGAAVGMTASPRVATQTAWSASVVVDHYADTSGDIDIDAVAEVTPAAGGSRIRLTMRGVPRNYRCTMIVVGTDGRRVPASTWTAPDGGSFVIPAGSSLSPDRIASIEVDLPNGAVLLRADRP
jgi:hypothetical protein